MFEELARGHTAPPAAPVLATESINTTMDSEIPPPGNTTPGKQDQPPEPKYGAVEIPLIGGDLWEKAAIRETPKDGGICDYEVYIMQPITNGNYFDEVINILKYASDQTTVTFVCCSPGGELATAARLVAAMKNTRAKTITIAVGCVASATALVWTHGQERIVQEGATIMIHMSSHWDYGNTKAIQSKAEFFVRYVKEIAVDPAVASGVLTAEEAELVIDRRQDVYIDSYEMTKRLEGTHG